MIDASFTTVRNGGIDIFSFATAACADFRASTIIPGVGHPTPS